MKKNTFLTLILTALIMVGMLGAGYPSSVAVYAAEQNITKTATLNNVKVSFNGVAAVTVQAYNIDGFNYLRARDLCKPLNVLVRGNNQGRDGIMIYTFEPYANTGTSPLLTKQSVNVEVRTTEVVYNGMPFRAECFNLDDTFYFKAADLKKVSQEKYDLDYNMIQSWANAGYKPDPVVGFPHVVTFEVDWDATTATVSVELIQHDMEKIYNTTLGTKSAANDADISKIQPKPQMLTPRSANVSTQNIGQTIMDESPQTLPTEQKQNRESGIGVLKSVPEVGSTPGNILIDIDGNPTADNMTYIYANTAPRVIGQCTWYVASRFREVHGINITEGDNAVWDDLPDWVSLAQGCADVDGTTKLDDIAAGYIGVRSGHVDYIEYVEYDDTGDPETVYYTDANRGTDGSFKYGRDGIVRTKSFRDYTRGLLGYVFPR